MMGMMRESAITYSDLIRDVLIGRENITSLDVSNYPKGVARAVVCGPH